MTTRRRLHLGLPAIRRLIPRVFRGSQELFKMKKHSMATIELTSSAERSVLTHKVLKERLSPPDGDNECCSLTQATKLMRCFTFLPINLCRHSTLPHPPQSQTNSVLMLIHTTDLMFQCFLFLFAGSRRGGET